MSSELGATNAGEGMLERLNFLDEQDGEVMLNIYLAKGGFLNQHDEMSTSHLKMILNVEKHKGETSKNVQIMTTAVFTCQRPTQHPIPTHSSKSAHPC